MLRKIRNAVLGIFVRPHPRLMRLFEKLLNRWILKDRNRYYGNCHGNDAAWILFIKNLLDPGRFLESSRYGRGLPVPKAFLRNQQVSHWAPGVDEQTVLVLVDQLNRYGVARLPVRHEALAKSLAQEFGALKEKYAPADHYRRLWINISASEQIRNYCADPLILTTLAKYLGCQPFFRDNPALNVTYPNVDGKDLAQAHFASPWHFDTVNMMSVHLLLADTTGQDCRTVFASNSHRKFHTSIGQSDTFFSDEFVRSKYKITDGCGPAGTVFIFDNNGIHKLEAVKNSFRATFETYFTPGNGLVSLASRRATPESRDLTLDPSLFKDINLVGLSPGLQQDAFDGLLGKR